MKMPRKLVISSLTLLSAITLAGSISGTFAWYQYSTSLLYLSGYQLFCGRIPQKFLHECQFPRIPFLPFFFSSPICWPHHTGRNFIPTGSQAPTHERASGIHGHLAYHFGYSQEGGSCRLYRPIQQLDICFSTYLFRI